MTNAPDPLATLRLLLEAGTLDQATFDAAASALNAQAAAA